MAIYTIVGDIVDNGQKANEFDVCPQDIRNVLEGLEENEPVELEITSFGGSCTAGNAIVSMLKKASSEGHRTTAHVISIAASMASVIACACDELIIDSNAFLMVHLPWSCVEGNYSTMRKEADTLELFTKSLVSIYRTKFNLNDEQIVQLLEQETWILGSASKEYGLKCTINEVDGELNIAAKCKYDYKNLPRGLIMNEEKKIEEEEVQKEEVTTEETPSKEEPSTEETKEEETPVEEEEQKEENEPTPEEMKEEIASLKDRIAELEKQLEEAKAACEPEKKGEEEEEKVTKAECDKRVSGMQASMQKQVNEFKSQLESKEKELSDAKASITSLHERLDSATKELTSMASALADKTTALDMLNSSVNAPSEELPTMKDGLAKCATPSEKVEFLKSGRYVR